jgi:hypothetical protein
VSVEFFASLTAEFDSRPIPLHPDAVAVESVRDFDHFEFVIASPPCGPRSYPTKVSPKTQDRIALARQKFMAERGATKRYIQTRRKVFQYGSLQAAEIALPRIRRTDHSARIIPEGEEYDVLRVTPNHSVVLLTDPYGSKA